MGCPVEAGINPTSMASRAAMTNNGSTIALHPLEKTLLGVMDGRDFTCTTILVPA